MVDTIVTELAVFRFEKTGCAMRKLVLTEIDENTSIDEIKSKTDATFTIASNLQKIERVPAL